EDFVGTTKIPLVSGVIHKVCVGVVSTVAGWVSGSVTVPLQMVGILDSGKGMPPDSYYSMFMYIDSLKPGYASVQEPLRTACFEYYRKTEMADSTATKVCGLLMDRYMAEGESHV